MCGSRKPPNGHVTTPIGAILFLLAILECGCVFGIFVFSRSFVELLWIIVCSEVRHLFLQCLLRIKLRKDRGKVHFIALIHLTYQTIAIVRRQPVPPNERKRRPRFHPRQDRHTTIHSPGGLVPASLARGT